VSDVNWLLVALSFALGMVITSALLVRPPVKTLEPARSSRAGSGGKKSGAKPSGVKAKPRGPRAPVLTDPPTEKIPVVRDPKTRKIAAANKGPARKVPPGKKAPARKVPPGKKVPAGKVPPGKRAPAPKFRGAKETPTRKIPVTDESRTQKISLGKESLTQKIPTKPFAPFGPGSARANPEGGGPAGWLVKGRPDTRLYYTPDDPEYDSIVAQVWFRDEDSAKRAYFTPWRDSTKK
jgi:uncharacterized membrane protein ArfC